MVWPYCRECSVFHDPYISCETVQEMRASIAPVHVDQMSLPGVPVTLESQLEGSLAIPRIIGSCGHVLSTRESYREHGDHWCDECACWVPREGARHVAH